ncbi:DUF4349 domain-containing protein [Pseudonocardia bannensis]|uniref:DUF4349 domain-containing protein n=1 Tax=Pseudonocardia bannensis TaxID=630973 RepID=A0A848DNM6_9PSEU|nr:DUF4349 domain-containing protein [Pseudonocardia bannensis]NMH94119.1 DUF4349 domain-containing protein [Pseudonocardia bannensis]
MLGAIAGIVLLGGAVLAVAGVDATRSGFAPGTPASRDAGAAGESASDAPSRATAVAPAPGAPQAGSPLVPLDGVDRAIVRTARLSVEVPDAVGAARDVRLAAAAAGGFVAEEQAGDRTGRLVLRVPQAGLDALVERVAALGRVLERSSEAQDVTEHLVDLDGRVASQQASVVRVRALLERAETVGEVVAVESELAQREAELESLQRRLAAVRDQVALSTLSIDLRTAPGPGADRPAGGFGAGLGAGWDGLRAIATAAAAVVGFVLPFLPVLVVLAALGWVGVRIVRSRRRVGPAGGPPAPDAGSGR